MVPPEHSCSQHLTPGAALVGHWDNLQVDEPGIHDFQDYETQQGHHSLHKQGGSLLDQQAVVDGQGFDGQQNGQDWNTCGYQSCYNLPLELSQHFFPHQVICIFLNSSSFCKSSQSRTDYLRSISRTHQWCTTLIITNCCKECCGKGFDLEMGIFCADWKMWSLLCWTLISMMLFITKLWSQHHPQMDIGHIPNSRPFH